MAKVINYDPEKLFNCICPFCKKTIQFANKEIETKIYRFHHLTLSSERYFTCPSCSGKVILDDDE